MFTYTFYVTNFLFSQASKESVLPKLEHLDCNDSLNQLHDFVTSKVEECTYTVPKKDRPKNPWITRETIQQGRLVNRLHKKFIKNNNVYNEYAYKNAKREHQKMRRNDKMTFSSCTFCKQIFPLCWPL